MEGVLGDLEKKFDLDCVIFSGLTFLNFSVCDVSVSTADETIGGVVGDGGVVGTSADVGDKGVEGGAFGVIGEIGDGRVVGESWSGEFLNINFGGVGGFVVGGCSFVGSKSSISSGC